MGKNKLNKKINKILVELNNGLIDREEQIKVVLLGTLGGINSILIGPPGTGKSEISRRIAKAFSTTYFEYLLTKFTTPEELFGPISLKKLEEDIFYRKTTGYLPSSKIVFLDEVFKGNSSILNSLLTLLNERVYHNGSLRQECDIYSIISASNELPSGKEELEALYDRFLIRVPVNEVDDIYKLLTLDQDTKFNISTHLNKDDLSLIKENISSIKVPLYIVEGVGKIIKTLREDGISISDRRVIRSIHILKVSALTNNRDSVNLSDLLILKYILWNKEDEIEKTEETILDTILKYSESYISQEEEIISTWKKEFDSLFITTIKDDNGKDLYIKEDGTLTTDEWGDVVVKTKYDEYVYYRGHSEYIKVLMELGKFDHGYVDTTYRTRDDKIIWKYEFSDTEVEVSEEETLEGYEKLSITDTLTPCKTKSFSEYLEYKGEISSEIGINIKNIKRNLEEELVEVNQSINYMEIIKNSFSHGDNIWVDRDMIEKVLSINTLREKRQLKVKASIANIITSIDYLLKL